MRAGEAAPPSILGACALLSDLTSVGRLASFARWAPRASGAGVRSAPPAARLRTARRRAGRKAAGRGAGRRAAPARAGRPEGEWRMPDSTTSCAVSGPDVPCDSRWRRTYAPSQPPGLAVNAPSACTGEPWPGEAQELVSWLAANRPCWRGLHQAGDRPPYRPGPAAFLARGTAAGAAVVAHRRHPRCASAGRARPAQRLREIPWGTFRRPRRVAEGRG